MYNTELIEDFLEKQNRQYSLSNMTKTLVVCGTLLLNTGGTISQPQQRKDLLTTIGRSIDYSYNRVYQTDSPTWSNVETEFVAHQNMTSDIPESFNLLNKLAFLEGDIEAEKEADLYFNQIQVKTKKIAVNRKA